MKPKLTTLLATYIAVTAPACLPEDNSGERTRACIEQAELDLGQRLHRKELNDGQYRVELCFAEKQCLGTEDLNYALSECASSVEAQDQERRRSLGEKALPGEGDL